MVARYMEMVWVVIQKKIFIIYFMLFEDIILWYKSDNNTFYTYILNKAKTGIEKLIETYNKSEKTSLIHTLSLYKNILNLESKELFKASTTETINMDSVFCQIKDIYDEKILIILSNLLMIIDEEKNRF